MNFTNPLQMRGTSAPSIQEPVRGSTTSDLLGTLGSGLQAFSQLTRQEGPSASEVTEERKTRGYQLGLSFVQKMEELEASGALSPDEFRRLKTKEADSIRAGLSYTEVSVFNETVSPRLGFASAEVAAERRQQADQNVFEQDQEAITLARAFTGKEMPETEALELGRVLRSQNQNRDRMVAELNADNLAAGVATRQANEQLNEAKVDIASDLTETYLLVINEIKSMPPGEERRAAMVQMSTELQRISANPGAYLSQRAGEYGIDVASLGDTESFATALGREADLLNRILKGGVEEEIDLATMNSLLNNIGSSTIEGVASDPTNGPLLASLAVSLQGGDASIVAQAITTGTSISPRRAVNISQAVFSQGFASGAALLPEGDREAPRDLLRGYLSTLNDMYSERDSEMEQEVLREARQAASSSLVNTIRQGLYGSRAERDALGNAGGVHTVLRTISQAELDDEDRDYIQNLMRQEGMEVDEVLEDAAVRLINNFITPVLRRREDNLQEHIRIEHKNGRIVVSYDKEAYEEANSSARNPQFRQRVEERGVRTRRRGLPDRPDGDATQLLKDMERDLNGVVLSRKNLTGELTEGYGEGLAAAVRAALGISQL